MYNDDDFKIDRAMSYGGIPYEKYLPKFEKTPMHNYEQQYSDNTYAIIGNEDELSVNNMYDNDPHKNYVMGEIINWTGDEPLFESDHPRRNPEQSKMNINMRYNGNRGESQNLPRHPELFYGFTGNDPRGIVNDPRFDQMRGFVTAHAINIEPSMGKNDDNQIAERPWTAQSISYDKKYLQQLTANNLKVFSTQKEGRPFSRNVVSDEETWNKNQGQIRKSNMEVADFSKMSGEYGEYIEMGGQVANSIGHDLQNIERCKKGININNYKTDQDFNINKTNVMIGSGNNIMGVESTISNTKTDHINIDSLRINNNFNKKSLASSIGLATKNAALSKQGMKNYTNNNGNTMVKDNFNGGDLSDNIKHSVNNRYDYEYNVGNIYKNTINGQNYNESTENNNYSQNIVKKNITGVNKNVISDKDNTISKRLNMVSSIVKGLKENTASSKRKIANEIIAQNSMLENRDGIISVDSNSKGLTPHAQYSKNISGIDSAIFKKYINDEHKINKFQPAPIVEKRVHFAKQNDVNSWSDQMQTQFGKNPEYQHDSNIFLKRKNALEQMIWSNSNEMQMFKTKNPELYEHVQKGIELSVINWNESDDTQNRKAVHEIQRHIMRLAPDTYTKDTWSVGYKQTEYGKNQSLSGRMSATNDPVEFGTSQDELFKQNNEAFSYGESMSGAPKTLRSGGWNRGDNTMGDIDNMNTINGMGDGGGMNNLVFREKGF
jgi:hypothetical protein